MKFVLDVMTQPDREEEEEDAAMEAAMQYYVSHGITTVHNMADDAFSPVVGEVNAFLRLYSRLLNNSERQLGTSSPLVRVVLAPPLYGVDDIIAFAHGRTRDRDRDGHRGGTGAGASDSAGERYRDVDEAWLLVNGT